MWAQAPKVLRVLLRWNSIAKAVCQGAHISCVHRVVKAAMGRFRVVVAQAPCTRKLKGVRLVQLEPGSAKIRVQMKDAKKGELHIRERLALLPPAVLL